MLAVVALASLATACGSDVAGEPPTLAELPGRIAAAQEVDDLMVVLGCTREHWREDVWDAEGAADRPTAEEAAAVVLADDHWEISRLPGGEREALFDQVFRLGPGLVLPVVVDGVVTVLLGYDAQGPDVWSIGGAALCVPMP